MLSGDGRWAALRLKPAAAAVEKAGKDASTLRDTALVMSLETGDTVCVPAPDRTAFSEDGRWFAVLTVKPVKAGGMKRTPGGDLLLRDLRAGTWRRFPFVTGFAIDSLSRRIAWSVEDTTGTGNGVVVLGLEDAGAEPRPLFVRGDVRVTHLTWNERRPALAFLAAPLDEKDKTGPAEVFTWSVPQDSAAAAAGAANVPAGWIVPSKNQLAWSHDGGKLFFGLRPASDTVQTRKGKPDTAAVDLFDVAALREKRELDIWHADDPFIYPHQRKAASTLRDMVYRAVTDPAGRVVVLADSGMPELTVPVNSLRAIGRSELPYRKEVTWDGEYADYYMVDLATGVRTRFLEREYGAVSLAPDGRHAAWFRDSAWYVYDAQTGSRRNLTRGLRVAFHDEENDVPRHPQEYGTAGWTEGGRGLLVYDRYDVWELPAGGGAPVNITRGEGRRAKLRFRVVRTDPRPLGVRTGDTLYLSAFHEQKKHVALYRTVLGTPGVTRLAEEPRRFTLVARARDAGTLLYRAESYTEFPDLWAADPSLGSSRRMSEANPQIREFGWGSAELVEWKGPDGKPLEGVLIKPAGYEPGKKYPVLVYFYETMSDRLHVFNEVVVNHRPCFPFYAGNGYAVFLPDVRYAAGKPGESATKSVVPGVQKLIAMGVADPKAVALHGHSWGGYETAFIVTQTGLFAAAIAGAPVGNMTSAYSGLRRGQGVARQFQYEQEQSRIGASMWRKRDLYIENSPVFHADRITTPLLIQHGDEDEAVPWEQAIEMHLALRRLGKPSILLQYRGEPHHLKKYPNKVDYTLRMKEYLDHYCKGTPAAEWIVRGEPFRE